MIIASHQQGALLQLALLAVGACEELRCRFRIDTVEPERGVRGVAHGQCRRPVGVRRWQQGRIELLLPDGGAQRSVSDQSRSGERVRELLVGTGLGCGRDVGPRDQDEVLLGRGDGSQGTLEGACGPTVTGGSAGGQRSRTGERKGSGQDMSAAQHALILASTTLTGGRRALRSATVREIDRGACGGSRVLTEPGKRGPVFVVSLVALVTGLGLAAWAVVEPQPAKYIVGVVLVAAGLAIQLYRAQCRRAERAQGVRRTGWRLRLRAGGLGGAVAVLLAVVLIRSEERRVGYRGRERLR